MTDTQTTQSNDLLMDAVANAITKQSFYQRYANTINSVAASLVAVLTALSTLWVSQGTFPAVTAALLVVVPVLTGVSTRLTKNSVTPTSGAKVIEEYQAAQHTDQGKNTLPVYDHGEDELYVTPSDEYQENYTTE